MVDSVKTFQSHLTSVMDSLVRASVCEITKLFQDTVNDYLVEISLNRKENEALKLRLRLTENKLRNERKYGMGWAASRRSAGLLVSDESGRKKRKAEMTRARQRSAAAFEKDWSSNPWEAGNTGTEEAGEAARDVYLVQLQGGEEEEVEECTARTGEEATNIKEESTEMDGGYRPESLRLIHEALQMDTTEQNLADVSPLAGVPGAAERASVEQSLCQDDWAPQIAPPEGVEKFTEPHRVRHGVEELSGLETALKSEHGSDRSGPKPDLSGPDHNPEDFASQASERLVNSLGDLEYVMAQKYIGLDGLCSGEQDSGLQSAQAPDRDANGLLDLHARMGPAISQSEARGFGSLRVKEGLRSLPTGGGDLRAGWLKRARDGEVGNVERLAAQPAKVEQNLGGVHTAQPGPGGAMEPAGDPGEFVRLCNQCGNTFSSAADLDDHPCLVSVHSQQHSCALCGKSFSQAAHLRAHMLLLHAAEAGERPHQCELCGKRFTHSRSLERHQLVHTGERPHHCPQCGRSFSRLGNLERHQRIHTGERPYGCAACGKRFSRVEYLRRHQQVHGGERPAHLCSHCGKSFGEPEQLKNHQCFYGV